jgi:hypothetical protein
MIIFSILFTFLQQTPADSGRRWTFMISSSIWRTLLLLYLPQSLVISLKHARAEFAITFLENISAWKGSILKIPTRKMAMEEEDSGGLGKKMDIYDIISNMENTPALQSAAITSDFIKVCYG